MAVHTITAIGDTHDLVVGRDVVTTLLAPFLEGSEMILHTGDVSTAAMLDDLEKVAPVVAVRSTDDPDLPPRLVDGPRSVVVGKCRIELHRTLDPDARVERDDADVVVHGGTHSPSILAAGRTLYVDPGAPVLTACPSAARIEIDGGEIRATIVLLRAE